MTRSFQFFSSLITSNRSIINGIFNYNQAFAAFIRGTRQKQDTALMVGTFGKKLREKQVSLFKPQPAKLADLGSANSKTAINYMQLMNHKPGFQYTGVDINSTFIREAEQNLAKEPLVKQFTLIHGDALSGNLKERKEFASQLFDFVFVSHTAYYLRDELACRAFITDITKMLSECGIALFLHEDSTHYFRYTYNKNNFKNISTPMLLEQSARLLSTNFNQFKEIKFTSKLKFPFLSNDLWENMKHPEIYRKFANRIEFVETLEKLAFIIQRDLIELHKEDRLSNYIDEIKEAIIANDYCFDLETHAQTIVGPKCALRHKIAAALSETQEEISSLLQVENNKEQSISLKI